jgi:hypothetical protein
MQVERARRGVEVAKSETKMGEVVGSMELKRVVMLVVES